MAKPEPLRLIQKEIRPTVPIEIENEELSSLVLAWAKTNRPDAYQKTLQVASNPLVFHNYLIRLVELRYEMDKDFRRQCPVRILDETALKIRLKDKAGTITEYSGKMVKGAVQNRIWELGLSKAEFTDLNKAKRELDLEYVTE